MQPSFILMYTPQIFDPRFGVVKPEGSLGLIYLASALRDKNFQVSLLDATVGNDNFTLEETFYREEKQPNGMIRVGMEIKDILKEELPNSYNDTIYYTEEKIIDFFENEIPMDYKVFIFYGEVAYIWQKMLTSKKDYISSCYNENGTDIGSASCIDFSDPNVPIPDGLSKILENGKSIIKLGGFSAELLLFKYMSWPRNGFLPQYLRRALVI